MPWIITGGRETFTAATISAEEQTIDEQTIAGETTVHRFPVVYLSAVIIHTPDGQRTPVQGHTLHGAGAYEITWTPHAHLEQDDQGRWWPADPQDTA